jgi:hypothetical protein
MNADKVWAVSLKRSWERGERKTQSKKTNRERVCKLFKTFVERIQTTDSWQKKSKVPMGASSADTTCLSVSCHCHTRRGHNYSLFHISVVSAVSIMIHVYFIVERCRKETTDSSLVSMSKGTTYVSPKVGQLS